MHSSSPLRPSPFSITRQCSRSPTARLARHAAAVLSTPPESTQTACPSPTASRILVTAWSM